MESGRAVPSQKSGGAETHGAPLVPPSMTLWAYVTPSLLDSLFVLFQVKRGTICQLALFILISVWSQIYFRVVIHV